MYVFYICTKNIYQSLRILFSKEFRAADLKALEASIGLYIKKKERKKQLEKREYAGYFYMPDHICELANHSKCYCHMVFLIISSIHNMSLNDATKLLMYHESII